MYNLPTKMIIVNDDSQVALLEDDGTAYAASDVSPTNPASGFILTGFLGLVLGTELNVLKRGVRLLKTAASAGVAEVTTYTIVATSNLAGATIRLVYQSLDLISTENQNIPLEKRYQIPANATAANIAADIAATINQDDSAPVTAGVAGAVVTLTAKSPKYVGYKFRLYNADFIPAAV